MSIPDNTCNTAVLGFRKKEELERDFKRLASNWDKKFPDRSNIPYDITAHYLQLQKAR